MKWPTPAQASKRSSNRPWTRARAWKAIKSAYEIAVGRYKSGLGNFIQVLLAQNEVQKQSLLNTDLRARAFVLDAQLATALGGGYDAAATTTH